MQKRILGSLFLVGCSVAYSNSPGNSIVHSSQSSSLPSHFSAFKQGHAVLQAGGYWSSQGKAQHIDIEDLIGDDFTLTKGHDSNGLIGLGYFLEGQDLGRTQLSYGVNAFYLAKTSVTGTVVQEDLFTNLSYSYDVTHYPVYFVTKVKTNLSIPHLSLMVDAGMGPNFMRTGGFSEQSLDDGITLPDNAFSGQTKTTFSATIGVSMQLTEVFDTMPLECGYRFFYLGQGQFSKDTAQLLDNLHTGPAYANAIFCAVRI